MIYREIIYFRFKYLTVYVFVAYLLTLLRIFLEVSRKNIDLGAQSERTEGETGRWRGIAFYIADREIYGGLKLPRK
jgi:hypothetical protein